MDKKTRAELLQNLRNSCEEGATGAWDGSPDGFEAMISVIDELAKVLRVELKDMEFHYARQCDECKKGMNEGYVVHNGDEYYCSDTCVRKHYSKQEWDKMYTNDAGYWTGWCEQQDMEYVGDRHCNVIREL